MPAIRAKPAVDRGSGSPARSGRRRSGGRVRSDLGDDVGEGVGGRVRIGDQADDRDERDQRGEQGEQPVVGEGRRPIAQVVLLELEGGPLQRRPQTGSPLDAGRGEVRVPPLRGLLVVPADPSATRESFIGCLRLLRRFFPRPRPGPAFESAPGAMVEETLDESEYRASISSAIASLGRLTSR